MNGYDDFDRSVARWLETEALAAAPTGRAERVIDVTRRRRPRPSWLAGPGSHWVDSPGPRGREWALRLDLPRQPLLGVLLALLAAAAIIGAAVVGAQLLRRAHSPFPSSTGNGWIAFAADNAPPDGPTLQDNRIYAVGETGVAKSVVGAVSDGFDRTCPAFSADGTQLAFGQARSASPTTYRDAALVIADIDADGVVSNERTIPVGGISQPPCPVWSPDGQRVAFIDVRGAFDAPDTHSPGANAVWIVSRDGGQIKKLTDVWASHLSWAPDGSRLAIATCCQSLNDNPPYGWGPILVYSVASGQAVPLPGTANVVAVSWSPDGGRIAYQSGIRGTQSEEIWTIDADGGGRTLQTQPFDANQGVGPVWSPSGDRIVYQRVCQGCREEHDVVLLTPGATASDTTPMGKEVVLPRAVTDSPDGREAWLPFEVSWSPDGRDLLYVAWNVAVASSQTNSLKPEIGLVLVDPGSGAAVLLHTGNIRVVAAGAPLRIPGTSWGRLP